MKDEPAKYRAVLRAVQAGMTSPHLDPGLLGEYASVLASQGSDQAEREFPETAAHLLEGCESCTADLAELLTMLGVTRPAHVAFGAWGRNLKLTLHEFLIRVAYGPKGTHPRMWGPADASPIRAAAASGGIPSRLQDMPIEVLDLSSRTANVLKQSEITTVGQLVQMTEDELLGLRNFGQRSLQELDEKLAARGIVRPETDSATSDLAREGTSHTTES